jgi:hypothetical protein
MMPTTPEQQAIQAYLANGGEVHQISRSRRAVRPSEWKYRIRGNLPPGSEDANPLNAAGPLG